MFKRTDPYRLSFSNPAQLEVTLFAGEDIPFDHKASRELDQMLGLQQTISQWQHLEPRAFSADAGIAKVVLTPDFHKASGIPVGTVLQTRGVLVPQAIGNDINCGMRLHTTSLKAEQIREKLPVLVSRLRSMFFEAGRNIPMNRVQRDALLRSGLLGLLDATPRSLQTGLWQEFHRQDGARDLDHTEQMGSLTAQTIPALQDFLGSREYTRDSQLGSIGGGNHFVELQRVKAILDPQRAHAWGLKTDQVVLMVHSGSVSVGYSCASFVREQVEQAHPRGLKRPANGLHVLPTSEAHQHTVEQVWDALHNAGNFAFANRMMLALMVKSVLVQAGLDTDFPLLYDSPHNLIWQEGDTLLHRKGATPARGFAEMQHTPFAFTGEPVLVPGSMGSSSFLLAGLGNPEALQSASHGAGRVLSRGQAMQQEDSGFQHFLDSHTVVTPLDFSRARADIAREKRKALQQERPEAYKNIQAIIGTLQGAQMALPVAELEPLLTIKG